MTGLGETTVVPDALRLQLGVEAMAQNVADALSTTRATMAQVRRAVSDVGIAAADQRTSGFHISQHHSRMEVQDGYVASESLVLMVREPDLVDVVLIVATEAAGDLLRVHGLGLTVTDPSAAQDDARRYALAAARRRAELYAAELGCSVGRLLRLVEGRGGYEDGDVGYRAMAHSGSPGVERGTQVVRMQVSAEWSLEARRGPPAPEPPDEPSTPDER